MKKHPEDRAALPARLEEMRPGQVRDAISRGATCLVPVGAMEAVADDAPLGGEPALEGAVMALAGELNAVVAPPIWYAPTGCIAGAQQRGTFDMPLLAFARYLEEVLITLSEVGFHRIEVVPFHSPKGKHGPLYTACRFVTADLFNNLWKNPQFGPNWWIRPDREELNWRRFAVRDLPEEDAHANSEETRAESPLPLRLERMTPAELKSALQRGLPCLVPSGVLENHGNHNPIGCDAFEAQDPVLRAASKAPAVVAPTIWYGPTGYAVTGPELATTNVDAWAYQHYVKGVVAGLAAMGFGDIIFIQVHQGPEGPQWTATGMAIQQLRSQDGGGPEGQCNVEIMAPPQGQYDHAGRNETSWMLHLRGDCTDLNLIRPGDYPFCWYEGREANTASAEWGRQMTERTVEGLASIIKDRTRPPGVPSGQ